MILKFGEHKVENVIRIQALPDFVKADIVISVYVEDENGEVLRYEIPKEEFQNSFTIINDNETRFNLFDND